MKLIIGTTQDLAKAVDFALPLQHEKTTRCRPLLTSRNREKLYELFFKYIERDEHALLLIKDKDSIKGVCPIYWMEEDKYVSYSQGPYGVEYHTVSKMFLEYVTEHFKGYSFYINTSPDHIDSMRFFQKHRFTQVENASLMKLNDFGSGKHFPETALLIDNNADEFYSLLNQNIDEDTYWNPERISANLNRFIILTHKTESLDGYIIGRIGGDSIEIIGYEGIDEVKRVLLQSFIFKVKKTKLKQIDLYTELESEINIGSEFNFEIYDQNICFIKHI